MQLRQAYAPTALRRRSELMGASLPPRGTGTSAMEDFRSPPVSVMTTSSPSPVLPTAEEKCRAGALADLRRKLAALQRQQQEDPQRGPSCSHSPVQPDSGGVPPGKPGIMMEHKLGSHSSALSPLSSSSSNEKNFYSNKTSKAVFSGTTEHTKRDDDETLTLQEMTFLRVVEFAIYVDLYAQLEPGAPIVELCRQATVKLFPRHLVFIRPDGVAVVELVIEELCELNEDEKTCALDCIVQANHAAHRQLIRAVCLDAIARGALFKLVSARRTQLEDVKRRGEKFWCQ